jgi:hypothetical protein
MVFEVRHWISNHEGGIGGDKPGNTVGNIFYGSKGYMVIDGYGKYRTYIGKEQQPGPTRSEGGSNWGNFIAALRSRKQADLNAPIEEGAMSCTLMHLANVSYRLGRTLHYNGATMQCQGDPEANKLLTRVYRKPYVVPEKF